MGLGQVQPERQRLRRERQGDRHHRHLQLGLRRHHHPGRQPGAGRRHRDDLAGEHVRLPDAGRARAATRPSRTSTTRPGRATTPASSRTTPTRVRRTPSSRSRIGVKNVFILNDKEAYGLGVATNFQNAAKSLGIKIAGFDGLRPEGVVVRGAVQEHPGDRRRRRLHRRSHLRERRPADQGQGRRARAERRRRQAAHAGRLRDCRRRSTTQARRRPACTCRSPVSRSTSSRVSPRSSPTNFSKEFLGGKTIDPYAIYGAQAATVMLDAIGGIRRIAQRRDLEDVRHQGRQRPARLVHVQRERRPGAGERCRRRDHDLQGDGQARDG